MGGAELNNADGRASKKMANGEKGTGVGYSDQERGGCKMPESDRVPAHETRDGGVQGDTNGSGPRKKRVPASVKSQASNNRKQGPMQMEEGGIRVRSYASWCLRVCMEQMN
jgi:hypothetical protein